MRRVSTPPTSGSQPGRRRRRLAVCLRRPRALLRPQRPGWAARASPAIRPIRRARRGRCRPCRSGRTASGWRAASTARLALVAVGLLHQLGALPRAGGLQQLRPQRPRLHRAGQGSTDVTYWPAAIANGVELRTGARVFEITTGSDGRATGARYFDADGKVQFQPARLVIVPPTASARRACCCCRKASAIPGASPIRAGWSAAT